jgi:hypothetical protein
MRKFGLLSIWAMVGCAASPPPVPETATPVAEPATPTLEKSADSGQVDRIGASDGALAPDGTNDLGFVATADGPIAALFLVAVDDSGKPSGAFQADTLVGEAPSPAELGTKPGNGTAGLGVVEGGKVLNAKDGSLQELAAGPHSLTLYIAPSPATPAGSKLRLYVLRPDKSVVAGSTVTN